MRKTNTSISGIPFTAVFICMILSITPGCSRTPEGTDPVERPVQSVADLTKYNFDDSIRNLHGEWRFRFGDVPDCGSVELSGSDSSMVTTPAYWSSYSDSGKNFLPTGQACYQSVVLLDPARLKNVSISLLTNDFSSASEIFWNGKLIGKKGRVGKNREEERGDISGSAWLIPAELVFAKNRVSIRISNHLLRGGGMNGQIFIGSTDVLTRMISDTKSTDYFLFGSILLAGLYYLALWIGRREEKSYFWFFLSCMSVSLRLFTSGSYLEYYFNPEWMTGFRMYLEYLTAFSTTCIFFLMFQKELFPEAIYKIPFRIILWTAISIGLFLTISRDASFYGRFQPLFSVFLLVVIVFGLVIFVRAIGKNYVGAKLMTLSYFIFFLAIANDLYQTANVTGGKTYGPLGLFIFVYGMAATLGRKFNLVHKELKLLSDSYARFVPQEFLINLGKKSIMDIRLGDQVQKEMTIMFADIRSFTELSEKMTPEENFNFINSYLKRMSPIIHKHNGFIDKFLGDGIMALFQGKAEESLFAAIEMHQYLHVYNNFRLKQGYMPIKIGIGIHTGKLMLGTIGGESRMDGTVISDAVNLAARIEGLTKLYGASIATSEKMFFMLGDPTQFNFRFLDRVSVKGKQDPVSVFEIIDGDSPEMMKLKVDTKYEYEKGIQMYYEKNFADAKLHFEKILEINPLDVASKLYRERSSYYSENRLPPDWEGIEVLNEK